MNYYNENDPKAAAWLRELMSQNLIPQGEIDERSISDVRAGDLASFTQCHFFAGIAGWPHALRLAGWPDSLPVWTGSCPCQPFSVAGRGLGTADERHLWPQFARLISECKPPVVFGEQVASKAGREWLSGIRADLEGMGYAVGAADLCAACVALPHARQRIYWVANSASQGRRIGNEMESWDRKEPGRPGQNIRTLPRSIGRGRFSTLSVSDILSPSYGVPGRMGLLRGYGNAIVPQVAQAFIEAYLETQLLDQPAKPPAHAPHPPRHYRA